MLNEDRALKPAGVATAVYDKSLLLFKIRHIENGHANEEEKITLKVKYTVVEMIADKVSTIVRESLDNILKTSSHNAKIAFRSVLYNLVEQVMLNSLHMHVIEEELDAYSAKYFNTDAADENLSKYLIA